MTHPHLALVGPTASGKSAIALEAARILGDVEIVSVDAMQVYRGMDIGTAKPSPSERAAVPHHLIDIADPWEDWSVVRFRDAAREVVADIEARGRRALLVGGTGLYFRAVVDPLEFPGEDRRIREEIDAEGPTSALYGRLAAADPRAASRIDPANRRRIVRALEVIKVTGRLFSSFGPGLDSYGDPVIPVAIVGTRSDADRLRQRIHDRLIDMRATGLVGEVQALLDQDRPLSRTASQAIGYAEVIEHLEGRLTEDEAFAVAERRTRRFARRQRKWFERDPRVQWLEIENPSDGVASALECWSSCHTSA
ncbi:MAG TPA: tRNA (adenosine(37)-N6)-dimethylallyltransferase MiaA [Acidimicrobiia bacterium]|nr:tRNA (adenosine(37)-N6)-dimethylallyltransferase MiaA [Acidimicrobiia bacterium]